MKYISFNVIYNNFVENILMKTRKQIYMDNYVKNKELYIYVYKTYIVLKVLKREIKAVKRKKEEGIMEEGKWEIKGEKKYYYYKGREVVIMSKEEEHYVDYIIKRFFIELKKTYKGVKYAYTIECSYWIHINIVCSIECNEDFRSWVCIKWAKIKKVKMTPQYIKEIIPIVNLDFLMMYINKGPVEVGYSLDTVIMLNKKFKGLVEEEKPKSRIRRIWSRIIKWWRGWW